MVPNGAAPPTVFLTRALLSKGGAMKHRILRYRTPPCHRRPVTAHQCSAALQHFQTSTECCLEFACRLSNVS